MGRNNKKNGPKRSKTPTTKKQATRTENPEGFQRQLIAWHFRIMDNGGNWPCNMETITTISNRLHEYEVQKWHEVVKQRSNHPMPVSKIEIPAQSRLSKLGLDDAETLYQLKIPGNSNMQRLWGLRQENVFQILWWDPNHTVYITKRRK
jgi:hypothetical protein